MNLWLYLAAINAVTYLLYWADKRAARNHGQRVPEVVLIGAGFLGGTIAAFIAMRVIRHKTRKTSFQLGYWAATIIQIYLLCNPPYLLQQVLAKLAA